MGLFVGFYSAPPYVCTLHCTTLHCFALLFLAHCCPHSNNVTSRMIWYSTVWYSTRSAESHQQYPPWGACGRSANLQPTHLTKPELELWENEEEEKKRKERRESDSQERARHTHGIFAFFFLCPFPRACLSLVLPRAPSRTDGHVLLAHPLPR